MNTITDPSLAMDERSWWDHWNRSHRSKDNNDSVSSELFERAASLVNEMTQTAGGRVLEVACGAGGLSRMLTYSTYCGLDLSPAAVELARERANDLRQLRGASRPCYEAADFHVWPLQPEAFDVVVCLDAIVCFRDQRLVMRKMAQSLRPEGHLLLTAVNPFVYNRIRRTSATRLLNGPVSHWLSCRELHEVVRSAGFTIQRSWTIMPRGECGILRVINSHKLNYAFGPRCAAALQRFKERAGLGQYRVVVARKDAAV
jgi:2-polyprenyl-3-methyl-5-hydroxy-6-metoxy-1,4-benzoquinol methylase